MDSFYNGFASVCKAARTIFGRTGDMRHGTSHRKQKSITALCLALLLLALPLLGGCLMFERPPAPLVCDQALVGRWLPLPDKL